MAKIRVLMEVFMDGYDDTSLMRSDVEEFVYEGLDSGGTSISFLDWEKVMRFIKFCAKEDLQIEENYFEAMDMASSLLKELESEDE